MSSISSPEIFQTKANASSLPISKRVGLKRATTPVAIVTILVISSVWLAFGHLEYSQHADSLVLTLASLQHWTPYFWYQDRYGMLIPLLTIPVHNPLTNMMLQSALGILAAFAAGFLLVSYFFQDSRVWWVAAALQNVWLILLASKDVQFNWLVDLPYAPSFALGFASLILSRKGRTVAALILMLLSHWVNIGAYLVLLPIVVFRYLITRERRELIKDLALVALGTLVGTLGKSFADAPRTPTSLDPVALWPSAWLQLFQHVRESGMDRPHIYLLWMIVPAMVGTIVVFLLRQRKYPLLVAASLVIVGVLNWLFVGTLFWVRANLYHQRYVFSSLFLFAMALAVLTVAPFQNAPEQGRRWAAIAAALAILVSGAVVYGKPSRSQVQRDMDQRYGTHTADILASQATLVAGYYWTVWPAVFDANLALYRRGEHRTIYGLSFRDNPTLRDWALERSVCAAAPVGDPARTQFGSFGSEAEEWMNKSPRHFKFVRRINTIDLYCEPQD